MLPLVLLTLLAGVLVGSGLAALALAPPNDACSDFGNLTEGSTSGGSLELWPLGLRCEYSVGADAVRSQFFGPGSGELLAWIVAATLLSAIALLRRPSAAARGAAASALLLAFAGAAWHFAGFNLAVLGAVFLGAPLVFAVEFLLRPAATRRLGPSLIVALALPAATLCAFLVFFFLTLEPLGIALAILAGALVSARLARWPRPRGDLLPSN